MAKKQASREQLDKAEDEVRQRAKRRTVEIQLQRINSDGTVEPTTLILSHKASARAVRDWLNQQEEEKGDGISYRTATTYIDND